MLGVSSRALRGRVDRNSPTTSLPPSAHRVRIAMGFGVRQPILPFRTRENGDAAEHTHQRNDRFWDEADIQNLIPPSPLAPTLSPSRSSDGTLFCACLRHDASWADLAGAERR